MATGAEAAVAAVAGSPGAGGAVDTSAMTDEQLLDMPAAAVEAAPAGATTPAEGEAAAKPASGEKPAATADVSKQDIDSAGRDWRKVPAELRETLRANDKLASMYFENSGFKAAFPDVKAAEAVAKTITELGGAEKLPEVMAELQQSRQLDAAYYGDDPKLKVESAEAMVRDNPQAFEQYFRAGAQALANFNPRAYEAIIDELRPSFEAMTGLDQVYAFAKQVVDGKSADGAMQIAQHLVAMSERGAKKAPDPAQQKTELETQRAEIDRRGQELDARDQKTFWDGANKSIDTAVVDTIADVVKGTLPEGIQAGAVTKIIKDIRNELSAELQKNAESAKQISELVKAKGFNDQTAAEIQTITLAAAKGLLPAIAKRVIEEWTTGVISINKARIAAHEKSAAATDVGTGSAPGGGTKSKFERGKVDYSKTNDDQLLA